MVMCKYFLRGTCRFGDSCKNEHSYNDSTASVMRKKGEADINVLIKAVSNDMDKAEKGNQWPLSCYGPFQGKPCFPGFEDKSFDEIRLGIYEAEKNGTVEQYKQQLTQLLHEARIKMRSLQNPTAEASHVLQELYNANNSEQPQAPNVFANTNTFSNNSPVQSNSVFGNTAAASKSIFNNQPSQPFGFAVPENKSIFGTTPSNSNSIFAQATNTTNSIFGGNQQPQQNQAFQQQSANIFKTVNNSIFGGQQTTANQSPFGGTQSNTNIFMQNNQSTQPPNPFKQQNIQAQTQPGQSPFAAANVQQQQQQSPFGNPTNFSTFPNQAQQQQPQQQFNTQPAFPSTFTQNTQFTASVPPANQSVFVQNQQPPQQPFGGFATTAPSTNQQPFASANTFQTNQSPSFTPQQTPQITENRSIFAQNQPNISDHSKSIFGSTQSTVIAAPVVPKQDDPTIYSKLEMLSESDVKSFEASTFEFGKIPDKPPTLQMCS